MDRTGNCRKFLVGIGTKAIMKLLFQIANDHFIDYDVSEDTTIDEVICELIDHGLPDEGKYTFIHEGRKIEGKFTGIKEYSIIIVVVTAPAPPAPATPPAQRTQESAEVNRNGIRVIRNEDFFNAIDHNMSELGIEQLYDPECNFWTHPEECARYGELIMYGANEMIAYNDIISRYHQAVRYSGAAVDDLYRLCGFQTREPVIVRDDLEVAIESMSDAQKASFRRLGEVEPDRSKLYKMFEECNFDERETLKRITEDPVPVD